jgi:hypothetical protein
MTVEKNKKTKIVIGESPKGNAGKIVIGESIPNKSGPNKSEPIIIKIISGSNQGN